MPIVTQSRFFGEHNYSSYFVINHGTAGRYQYPNVTYSLAEGFQTTTSYRSKGPTPDVDDEEALIANVRNRQEFAKRLKTNYRTKYDNGHEFSTERSTLGPYAGIEYMYCLGDYGYDVYTGYHYPSQGVGVDLYPPMGSLAPTKSKINVDGRDMINSTIPTAPEAALSQLLFELREKLPSLVGYQSFVKGPNAKSLGGEHLNIEFGIKPLISDIQKLAQQVLNYSQIVKQYARDSGSQIRRKRVLSRDSVAIQRPNYPGNVMLGTRMDGVAGNHIMYSGSGGCSVQLYDTVTETVKFAGAYSYHLSQANSFLGKAERYEQLANQLLGARFTPETLYELTPWSWLFDWFGDAGNFVSNSVALSQDSLVLRYGYVMHHTVATRYRQISVMPPPMRLPSGNYPTSSRLWSSVERKTRTRASPYGFGLTEESFSGKQWAILAALGMTKTPTSLK